MNLNLKFLTGTTIALLLSAVAIAPAKAQSSDSQMQQQTQQQSARQQQIGKIQSVSGSTATVVLADGTTQSVLLSPNAMEQGDMKESDLAPNSYVLIRNGEIAAPVQKGRITEITGTNVYVNLENGGIKQFNASKVDFGRLNLNEGTPVYVSDNTIVDIVRPTSFQVRESTNSDEQSGMQMNDRSSSDESQTGSGTYESPTGPQTQGANGTYESQPETQTKDNTRTYDSQTNTTQQTPQQQPQEPVRGMQ
jgi:hypothetical protein